MGLEAPTAFLALSQSAGATGGAVALLVAASALVARALVRARRRWPPLEAAAVAPGPVEPTLKPRIRRARVAAIRHEAPDVKSFRLVSDDGGPLPTPSPGAHIDVHPAPGVVRQYALCNGPRDTDGYLIAVRRDSASRGCSRALHDLVTVGDTLEISEPRNHFPVEPGATEHLLLARGIGVAPLISIAQALAEADAAFRLEYFARSPEHVLFKDVLARPELNPHVALHHGLEPQGEAERLRTLLAARPSGAHLYVCGTPAFMDQVAAVAAPAWPRYAIHREYFNANPAAWAGERRGFDVKLTRSGRTIHVPPELNIATALVMAGVELAIDCEQGVCRSCLTRVLAGTPDHRDAALTALERERGDCMLVCVSRAVGSEITLDL